MLLLLVVMMLGGFIAQLAVIEQDAFRLALSAGLVRLLAVAVVTVQGCASLNDEIRNGQVELTLALNLSRSHYLVGRALGGAIYAIFLALFAMLVVCWWAPWSQVMFWGLGLACELIVMALFALFVAVTFTSLAASLLVSVAFYLLSRFIEPFVLMTTAVGAGSYSSIVVWISWLVPNFSRYNQSSWLVYADGDVTQLVPVMAESFLVCGVLLLAALVDFHRREV
ncbi:MAG: hypothetical protein DRQ60_02405 [Gammaproteobacteria bacterium]|nr:MAG: hypothetical protein DRQ60_02405 [Gammaproteobacteria bacterium]